MGERLLAEQRKNPEPFTRERFRYLLDHMTRTEAQEQLAAYKAVAPKLNLQEELLNDPDVASALRQATDSVAQLDSWDPSRELREKVQATMPLPKPGQWPSPHFFFELIRVAEQEGSSLLKARAVESFVAVNRALRELKERETERKQTDVRVADVPVPVPAELAASVPFQAYAQAVQTGRAQLQAAIRFAERSAAEVQAAAAELTAEKASLRQLTVDELGRRQPQWTADAFRAQEQHRWFERALDEPDDAPAAADSH